MFGTQLRLTRVFFAVLFGSSLVLVPAPAGADPIWSIDESPNQPDYSDLNDVSCVSPTSCIAVGFSGTDAGGERRPFVLRWNGSAWSIAPSPNPVAHGYNELLSVSCVS